VDKKQANNQKSNIASLMNKKLNQDHQPRILWNSNAPWAPTGYGMQTAQVVRRLKQNNYE